MFDTKYCHEFRSPKGKVKWVAEKLEIDRSYETHYNFVNTYVKLRCVENPLRTTNVEWDLFKYKWQRIKPLKNPKKDKIIKELYPLWYE